MLSVLCLGHRLSNATASLLVILMLLPALSLCSAFVPSKRSSSSWTCNKNPFSSSTCSNTRRTTPIVWQSSSFRPRRQDQRPTPDRRRDGNNNWRQNSDNNNNNQRNDFDDDNNNFDSSAPTSWKGPRREERFPSSSSSSRRGPAFSLQNQGNNQRQPLRSPTFDDDDDDDEDEDFNAPMAAAEAAAIPSHFFSKKSLQDPAFVYTVSTDSSSSTAATTAAAATSTTTTTTTTTTNELFQKLCQGAGITRPSRIQALAWPILLQQEQQSHSEDDDGQQVQQQLQPHHTIVADQTGSGKTLAYLLPLLQRTLTSKARDDPKSKLHGTPRLLILTPTAELADQIKSVCDRLMASVPFSTMVMTATGLYVTNIRDQIRLLQRQPVDVLISTPGRMATILRTKSAGGLNLTKVQSIVLDEVDILLQDDDATFGDQLRTIAQAAPVTQCQFVFVTATLPDRIVQTITQEFPKVVQVRGPGLHRVAPTLDEHLVDVSVPRVSSSSSSRHTGSMGDEEEVGFQIKSDALLQALRRHASRKTLVFCNTVNSCRQVENLLQRHDRRGQKYQVGAYHNAMTPQARNQNLARFNVQAGDNRGAAFGQHARNSKRDGYDPESEDEEDYNKRDGYYNDNNKNSANGGDDVVDQILVCTDRAARGVDFGGAPVDHVILFDFPKDPAEYVRRVGRTARAGRPGTCTILAYGWQLPIARQLMNNNKSSGGNNNKAKPNTFVKAMKDWEVDSSSNSDNDMDEGPVVGRHPNQPKRNKQNGRLTWNKSNQEQIIKGNIEGGRLWKERRSEDDPPPPSSKPAGKNAKRVK